MGTELMAPPNGGASIVRHGFSESSIEQVRETAQAAMTSQARAQIEAQYVVARAHPRSWDDVRAKLLAECKRPAFAKAAWFRKPQGGSFVQGLSVRFAETALRLAGNLRRGTRTTYEDEYKRQLNVFVIDCETNAETSRDITLAKTVERKSPAGRLVIQSRTNTAGEPVFIVSATEDEMMAKEGAIVSKVARVLILQMIPGDIQDDCREQIQATRADDDAKDPAAARKTLMDAFAAFAVLPEHLVQYLGHDVAQCSPAEIEDLRGVYAAIRDGECSWAEILAERTGSPPALEAAGTTGENTEASRGKRLSTRVRKPQPEPPVASAPAATAPNAPPGAAQEAPKGQTEIPGTQPPPPARPAYVTPPTTQTLASSMSIEEDRARLVAQQNELVKSWPYKLGDKVVLLLASGSIETSVTSGPRMFGDMAVVNVSSLDTHVHIEKIVAPPKTS